MVTIKLTKAEAEFLRGVLVGWFEWVLSSPARVINKRPYEIVLDKLEDAISNEIKKEIENEQDNN